jgi:peptidyl-prolyl cis-trans isomerase A (cyclophilin A)
MTTNTNPIVDIETPLGTISVEIDAEHAPGTAANFLGYVDRGEYDGSRFYRTVTPDNQPNDAIRIAVIQGGMASLDDYPRRDVDTIELERTTLTGLRHLDGTISMARMTPDSGNSEFFICVGDQPDLDFGGMRNPDGQGFAAFGQVVDGMNVVHAVNTSQYEGQHLTPPIAIVSIKRRG